MVSRQEIRSEETKRAILSAARELFAERGYDAVTMREIARAAGCSHTTIYIYYKDKEDLLHQLSMGPLQSLFQQLNEHAHNEEVAPDDRLRQVSRTFIQFCLANRTMYNIFFMTKGSPVDEEQPAMEIQKMRNQLFGLLMQVLKACISPQVAPDMRNMTNFTDVALAYARIYFFAMHGIIATYTDSDEPYEVLMERLAPTFELAVEVLLAGFKQTSRVKHTSEGVDGIED